MLIVYTSIIAMRHQLHVLVVAHVNVLKLYLQWVKLLCIRLECDITHGNEYV